MEGRAITAIALERWRELVSPAFAPVVSRLERWLLALPWARYLPISGPTRELLRAAGIDGDTVDLSNGQRVRLIGIDAPETGSGSCATKATNRMKALVLGQIVKVTPGARDDKDKYGRLLRYVETAKYDAGRTLINEGLAIARYDSRDGYGTHPREAKYVWADSVTPNCVNSTGTAARGGDI